MGREPASIDETPIWSSAYRHGYRDEQIRHALRNLVAVADDPNDDEVTLFMGPHGPDAAMIEVGVLDTEEGPVIIHAMAARTERFGD